MSVKITGLKQLTRELDQAAKAARALDGEVATVSFDPTSAASVEAAIRNVEAAVDAKLASYANNPLVAQLVSRLKEIYAREIKSRAKSAAGIGTASA